MGSFAQLSMLTCCKAISSLVGHLHICTDRATMSSWNWLEIRHFADRIQVYKIKEGLCRGMQMSTQISKGLVYIYPWSRICKYLSGSSSVLTIADS